MKPDTWVGSVWRLKSSMSLSLLWAADFVNNHCLSCLCHWHRSPTVQFWLLSALSPIPCDAKRAQVVPHAGRHVRLLPLCLPCCRDRG